MGLHDNISTSMGKNLSNFIFLRAGHGLMKLPNLQVISKPRQTNKKGLDVSIGPKRPFQNPLTTTYNQGCGAGTGTGTGRNRIHLKTLEPEPYSEYGSGSGSEYKKMKQTTPKN